jgi:Uma2 family endonuclease
MQALDTQTSIEVNFSPLLRRYTLEEFWALPEREDHARYNLIGGFLFMVPPPNPPHGDVASRMTRSLVGFLVNNQIEGDVHHPPEPIYIRAECEIRIGFSSVIVNNRAARRIFEDNVC